MVGSDWSEVFVAPVLLEEAPTLLSEEGPVLIMVGFILNFAVYSLGWLLFGIATFRARVFPRAAAILLMVGVLLPLTGLPWIFIVWNSAVIWLGLSILREKGRASSTAGVEARSQVY